jgi:hypothetical protein
MTTELKPAELCILEAYRTMEPYAQGTIVRIAERMALVWPSDAAIEAMIQRANERGHFRADPN